MLQGTGNMQGAGSTLHPCIHPKEQTELRANALHAHHQPRSQKKNITALRIK